MGKFPSEDLVSFFCSPFSVGRGRCHGLRRRRHGERDKSAIKTVEDVMDGLWSQHVAAGLFFLSLQGGGEVPLEKRMWSERQFAVTLINITD